MRCSWATDSSRPVPEDQHPRCRLASARACVHADHMPKRRKRRGERKERRKEKKQRRPKTSLLTALLQGGWAWPLRCHRLVHQSVRTGPCGWEQEASEVLHWGSRASCLEGPQGLPHLALGSEAFFRVMPYHPEGRR